MSTIGQLFFSNKQLTFNKLQASSINSKPATQNSILWTQDRRRWIWFFENLTDITDRDFEAVFDFRIAPQSGSRQIVGRANAKIAEI